MIPYYFTFYGRLFSILYYIHTQHRNICQAVLYLHIKYTSQVRTYYKLHRRNLIFVSVLIFYLFDCSLSPGVAGKTKSCPVARCNVPILYEYIIYLFLYNINTRASTNKSDPYTFSPSVCFDLYINNIILFSIAVYIHTYI